MKTIELHHPMIQFLTRENTQLYYHHYHDHLLRFSSSTPIPPAGDNPNLFGDGVVRRTRCLLGLL